MKNKSKLIVLMSGILVIFLMVFGVSFAIFRYGETGTSQELVLGDIWMKYEESNGIQLENVLPGDEYKNYFEFTITGTNTYTKKDIWYDISLTKGDIPSGKVESNRIGDEYLKFRLIEIIDGVETEIFTDKTYNDLTNKRIHVDTISKSTNEYSKTYRLYMTISEELTYGNAEGSILTTEEFGKIFGSVKVNVTGDFNEKELAYEDKYNVTDASCFGTKEIIVYEHNKNMTLEELNLCVNKIKELGAEEYLLEGETIESYCRGTGTIDGSTFQEYLDNGWQPDIWFEENNIIIKSNSNIAIDDYDVECGGTDVVIPRNINGKVVTEIYSDAFKSKGLTSVVIPNTILYIWQLAFYDNQLTSVIIPGSVIKIDYSVFKNNQLTNVIFENGVKYIDDFSFIDNNITTVTLPNSVIYFGCGAFDDFVTINKSDDLTCTVVEWDA